MLLSAAGLSHHYCRALLGKPATVSPWRQRFRERVPAGLDDELRPGGPRSHDDEAVSELINRVLHAKPKGAAHRSVRLLGAETAEFRPAFEVP